MHPKIIAFDADDTLWHNEPYFDEAQERFCQLFREYISKQEALGLILAKQIKNMALYGFGIKAFTLSMLDAALEITQKNIDGSAIAQIIEIGKDLLQKPVELLPNIEEVLASLQGNYKLVVATKGDLKDQHRKLHDSGIGNYFHHIEVLSDKTELDYTKMFQRLNCLPQDCMMVGNSLKSDVLPILNLGGIGVHIPYVTTWEFEKIDFKIEHTNFIALEKITDLLAILKTQKP